MKDHIVTEENNTLSKNLDLLSSLNFVELSIKEDIKVLKAVKSAKYQISNAIDMIYSQLKIKGRLIYIGAGTSGRLGILDAVECWPTFSADDSQVRAILAGGNSAICNAIEGAEDDTNAAIYDLKKINLNASDALVGIAASGQTPYVISALEYANQIGASSISISCNLNTKISEISKCAIELNVGPEIITGSTRLKSATATKIVLNMLSNSCMIKLGKVYKNYMVDLRVSNNKLQQRAINMLAIIANIDHIKASKVLKDANNNVKVAIIMSKYKTSYQDALKLLDKNNGYLRAIL